MLCIPSIPRMAPLRVFGFVLYSARVLQCRLRRFGAFRVGQSAQVHFCSGPTASSGCKPCGDVGDIGEQCVFAEKAKQETKQNTSSFNETVVLLKQFFCEYPIIVCIFDHETRSHLSSRHSSVPKLVR